MHVLIALAAALVLLAACMAGGCALYRAATRDDEPAYER